MQYANDLLVFIDLFKFEDTTISKWHNQFLDLCSTYIVRRTVYTYNIHSERDTSYVSSWLYLFRTKHRLDSPVQKRAFQTERYIEYAKDKCEITIIIIVVTAVRR
jgi:hypothetical protein